MNPLNWKREHQLALAIAAAIGFACGLVFAGHQPNHLWFMFLHYGVNAHIVMGWALLGAAIGGGIVYARQLLR